MTMLAIPISKLVNFIFFSCIYDLLMHEDGNPSSSKAYSSEELSKTTEEQLRAAAAKQQGESTSPGENQSEIQSPVALKQMDVASSGGSQTETETDHQG